MKLITTHPIKKSDLGLHNNLFGGKLLAWIDAAGAAFTTEYVDSPRLVTVMIDKCIFKKPAKEGQLLKIYGQIKEVGTSSITAYLEARAHNVYDGNKKLILSTSIKFVRIDEGGDPIPIHQRIRDKFESGNK